MLQANEQIVPIFIEIPLTPDLYSHLVRFVERVRQNRLQLNKEYKQAWKNIFAEVSNFAHHDPSEGPEYVIELHIYEIYYLHTALENFTDDLTKKRLTTVRKITKAYCHTHRALLDNFLAAEEKARISLLKELLAEY